MFIEHVAFNVKEPAAQADWYVKNLGMKIVRSGGAPTHGRFVADAKGRTVLELYNNTKADVPDYFKLDPLILHVAFLVEDMKPVVARLSAAGAKVVAEPSVTPDGDTLAMLRDPWGLAVQLVQRAKPLM